MRYRLHLIEEQRASSLQALTLAAACDQGEVDHIRSFLPKRERACCERLDRALDGMQAAMRPADPSAIEPRLLIGLIESDGVLPDARHLFVLIEALEFRIRLGLGQVAIAFERYRALQWRAHQELGANPGILPLRCKDLDRELGGAISLQEASLDTRRAYEISKVCRKAHAEFVKAASWSVDHDGLIVRYTNDQPPAVALEDRVAA